MVSKAPVVKRMRGSLAQHAYFAIRKMILRGELPPGSSISRRSLADLLGVSFLPVSEALQRLEYDGLVESWPRIGTRVRVPTREDVRGNYVIREALETQSVRLFAEKASRDEREEIGRLARQVDELQRDAKVDFFDFFETHERFHRRIAECTGCPALTEAIDRTNTLVRTWLYASMSHFREMPPDYHVAMAAILAGGSPEDCDRAMRQHVRHGMDEVLSRLEPWFRGEGDYMASRPR